MDKLKTCPKCKILPAKETKRVMLGKIKDGGYEVTDGRFICPKCGFGPSWGQSYCVDYGWDKNAELWNRRCDDGK